VAEARDANDSGQIAGWSARFDGIQRAVRWTITGPGTATVQDLGTLSPAGGRSQAVAINERGQIAGWAETASGVHHAFLWTQGGTEGPAFNSQMRDLGGPAVATDVNERGHVCGAILSGLPLILTRPFIWTPDERMVQLPADTIGNTFGASAAGINDDDVIVGQSGGRAVLWRGNGMEDLNGLITPDSGWFLIQALAVNRSREIVGYGAKNGEVRGWFLAPIF
jgi:probable HAF family extracellular repeat protein